MSIVHTDSSVAENQRNPADGALMVRCSSPALSPPRSTGEIAADEHVRWASLHLTEAWFDFFRLEFNH